MRRILAITLIALVLPGCALFNSATSTSVPFRLLNNHILMPVKVNGTEMTFIFDSSAKHTVLMGDSSENLAAMANADGSPVMKIEIGDLTLSKVSAKMVSLKENKGFHDTDSIYFDGVIGHDLLNRYIVEINYDNQLISFQTRSAFDKYAGEHENSWESLPVILIQGQPAISMPITLGENAQYLDFTLSTGSNIDMLLPKEALDKDLTPAYSYTFHHFDWSGEHQYQVYPLDRTYLGDHPKIWPLVHTPLNSTDHIKTQFGMIGNAILSRFNLIIDMEGKTLYFQENQRHSIKNFPDRSGLTIGPHISGAIVTRVVEPASSLLKVGDIIQSYEGIDITEATFDSFRLMLSSEAEALHLWWLRNGQQYNGYLQLEYRM